MSKLRHIYRSNKLSNIAQKRYTRKYSREYLEEKAARGASIKLGFGDFDGDGDLDGLYPKQRAGVAEKPGLHVYPPRGTLRKLKGAASPTYGPGNIQSSLIKPEAGPRSLTTLQLAPILGPFNASAELLAPAAGPSSLNAINPLPSSGPNSLSSSVVVPSQGPDSLSSSVIAPSQGPLSLNAITNPLAGPTNLSAEIEFVYTEFKSFSYGSNTYGYVDMSTDGLTMTTNHGKVYTRASLNDDWVMKINFNTYAAHKYGKLGQFQSSGVKISGDGRTLIARNSSNDFEGQIYVYTWDRETPPGAATVINPNRYNHGRSMDINHDGSVIIAAEPEYGVGKLYVWSLSEGAWSRTEIIDGATYNVAHNFGGATVRDGVAISPNGAYAAVGTQDSGYKNTGRTIKTPLLSTDSWEALSTADSFSQASNTGISLQNDFMCITNEHTSTASVFKINSLGELVSLGSIDPARPYIAHVSIQNDGMVAVQSTNASNSYQTIEVYQTVPSITSNIKPIRNGDFSGNMSLGGLFKFGDISELYIFAGGDLITLRLS
jgi:hypothetical protein